MKIVKVNHITQSSKQTVMDCAVKKGYWKAHIGSLPDVDLDFQSDRRQEVKEYLELRYGHGKSQRVFSAGTFTTEKVKSAMKDIAFVYRISRGTTNYITAIIDDDNLTWTGLMKLAFTNKKVMDFIQKHPRVFEEMRPLLDQPRSAGIHASACIITPDTIKGRKVECYEILPVRKQNGMLVSELSGADIDSCGILKNDLLAIAELSRIKETLNIVKSEYGKALSILEIIDEEHLKDALVYENISRGFTQGLFQLSSPGMTKFIKQLKPSNIEYLIAAVALFRPATIESGSVQKYIDIKNGYSIPEYLWGTYDALSTTFSCLVYQEQLSQLARDIGGFSLGEGVKLVKLISKKKVDKIKAQRSKFMDGAKKKGCPKEAAETVWAMMEAGGSYLFNKSHATAYALTSFVGAWLKTHYPVAFYTVQLKWVEDEKLPVLMNEIDELEGTSLAQPNINISGCNFMTDYKCGIIYWSLGRIKMVGVKSVQYIERDRELYGKYVSLKDFVLRIFKNKLKKMKYKAFTNDEPAEVLERNPVTTLHLKNMIIAGAFDEVEHIHSANQRYYLLRGAARMLGFELKEKDVSQELKDKTYYWQQKQIDITGFGSIDYDKVIANCDWVPDTVKRSRKLNLKVLNQTTLMPEKYVLCATIAEVSDKTYKDKKDGSTKHFGKIIVRQNNYLGQVLIWNDTWIDCKDKFVGKVGQMVVAICRTEWSDFDEKNIVKINKNAFVTNPE